MKVVGLMLEPNLICSTHQTTHKYSKLFKTKQSQCNSPQKANIKKKFEQNIAYYSQKLELLRKERVVMKKRCTTCRTFKVKNVNDQCVPCQVITIGMPLCTNCDKRLC